jgi:16S rRNA C967 or C1407 C5-methylase (RsmB/RsmF family)/NOL1/NOP2/fmu family ribosome biogenesis protein
MTMSHELPKDFVDRVLQDPFLGQELLDALQAETPVSIRRNPWKSEALLPVLRPIPWSENGFFLSERPQFTLDPLFHAGCYYPQEAGSQLLDAVLKAIALPESPVVLDLCAAPGGKSTLIASRLNNTGLLVSNEVIRERAKVLKENLTKWGASNTVVTNNDPADFARVPHTFDCIVVDAPCSGEGMFRKDHAARDEWSQNNVDLCAARQRRIVMDVWESLKPGGYLVYSTCTFNTQENEENVAWFARELEAEIVPVRLDGAKPDRTQTGWYALPNELDTEGFYLSVLRKPDERSPRPKQVKNQQLSLVKDTSFLQPFLQPEGLIVLQWQDFVFAVPEEFRDLLFQLHQQLRVIKLGTELGETIRKGLLPNEALALNPAILHPALPRIELTREQALSYLHGDTFTIAGTHGFQLMTYQNEPLGWIKHLGNRFNNLYPKEWRIRMKIS